MIERIQGLPESVLGFTAKVEVTGADYEPVIIPAVEEMLARQKKIRLLYHLGTEFKGFDAGAMWDDARMGLQHLNAWERIAVVTDAEWLQKTMKAFTFVTPGHIRIFANRELADAKQWLSG